MHLVNDDLETRRLARAACAGPALRWGACSAARDLDRANNVVDNRSRFREAAVGAVFSVHNGVRFHRPRRARVTKVTDDIGRFDDESR